MPITDYNKKKPLEVSSRNDSGTTQDKAQPIIVRQGAKLTGTTKSEADSGSTTTSRKEFATVLSLKKDALVTTVGFESNDNTDVTIKIQRNSDSKILAEKTVTPVAQSFTEVSFTAGDYTSFPSSGDTVNVFITESGTASLRSGSGGTRSNTLFDITNNDTTNEVERIAGTQNSNGGTAIQCETYESGASKTGTGDVTIDFTNISDAQDIAVYDENGNLLDYEIESLDTAAETGVIWAYDSWVRDDTVQAQVAYGNNTGGTNNNGVDRQNVTGTWNHTGQNSELIQHFNEPNYPTDDAIDSSPNNRDGTVTGASSITAQINGGLNGDGTDDVVDFGTLGSYGSGIAQDTFAFWIKFSHSNLETIFGTFNDTDDTGLQIQLNSDFFENNDPGNIRFFLRDQNRNLLETGLGNGNLNDGNWHRVVITFDSPNNDVSIFVDGVSQTLVDGSDLKREQSPSDFTDFEFPLTALARNVRGSIGQNFEGDVDELGFFREQKSSDWIQADFDASPKAGQVYFSQQAAEPLVTDQTVTVPETQTISSNPDPQVNATVDISVPTSTATTVNPAPTVSPGAAPLNLTASTANTANPDFTVQPGNTTVQTPVSTATVSNPDPAVNAFNEVTVPETSVATDNPAPTLTVGQTIITPETTVTSSNPDLTVQPGETSLNISTTEVSATNPVIGLNRQILVGVATNLESENPEPNLQAGAVSVQVPETTILTENPELQVQPGATSLQTEQATSLQTVNPDFNTVSGAAELQVSETQLKASVQEPSIGLTLQFVSPTNALITNDERFFDMPDHTFTEGDLGDTLTATLKDEVSPDGVDLTGATEIRLVVKDRDGVKVFDKEMSIVDSSTGDVEYKWDQGDFIGDPGVYRSKIKVFDSSGEPESFPNDGFRTIEVEEEIG